MLMDEVFGENNFVSLISNINNPKGRSDDKYIPTAHEYLLVYKKDLEPSFYGWMPEQKVLKRYKPDDNGNLVREIDLRKTGDEDKKEDREDMFYYFYYSKKNNELYPSINKQKQQGDFIEIIPLRKDKSLGRWRWGIDTAKKNIEKLKPKLMPIRKVWTVFEIDSLTPDERVKPTTAWTKKDFNSERGTEQFIDLGFKKEDFPRPKPIGLLKHIFAFASKDGDIILDSFAGTGTTAHAVFALNKEDGGNRKFILVE